MGLTYPPLRRSDLLNATNATRYDWVIASPSDSLMRSTWITWSVITGTVAFACLLLIFSLLSSPRARRKSFNLYLVFLTAPDALFSGMCTMTCALSAASGRYYSEAMCEWQSWYCVFGFTANMWMNMTVASNLHDMLRTTSIGRRYEPPKCGRVCREAAAVYVYASFMASWTLIPERAEVPIRNDALGGVACLPAEYSLGSTLFFWLLFMPLMMGVPIVYIAWVCYDVYMRGLLPRSGRNRFLALYFLRLVFVFVIMWLPAVILIFGVAMRNYWISFMGGTWSHLQGLASAAASLTKPDVRMAVQSFVFCQCRNEKAEVWRRESLGESSFRRSSAGRSLSMVSGANSSRRNSGFNLGNLQIALERDEDDFEENKEKRPTRVGFREQENVLEPSESVNLDNTRETPQPVKVWDASKSNGPVNN